MRTRHALSMLLAIAGAHCGGDPPDLVADEESSQAIAPAVERRLARPPAGVAPRDPEEQTLGLLGSPSAVTSRVVGEDGATYVAGLFSGSMSTGEATLESRGDADVFLARVERDGRVGWSLAVGSRRAERAPRVTFRDGRVELLAETRGEVDCGHGPMNTWSSGMFFVCVFDANGRPIQGGTFPTGAP